MNGLVLPNGESLPTTVDGVTSAWCSKILNAPVEKSTIISVRHGSSSTLVVNLEYAPAANKTSLPQRIFFKGGFNPELIAIAPSLLDTYRREAEFYHYISPKLISSGMNLPKTWYSGIDSSSGQGIVVLEDLTTQGCSFGTPSEPWPVDRVIRGVEQLAILHAKTWNCTQDPEYKWMNTNNGGLRGIILELTKPGPFNAVVAKNLEILGPDFDKTILLDSSRIVTAFEKLWESDTSGELDCFIHGDPHIDNTYMTASGEPGFLDWQAASTGNCFHDVSYFVTSALAVEDRRASEERIVRRYLETLKSLGARQIDWATGWQEYKKHLFHGYVLALTQPGMQSQENIWDLVGRFIPAIVDHSVIELLEQL
ncbi:hypothetical protein KVR01_007997 [Diaporthe batatas]|uniref:uncharacterized protein n=1 Tax=Diaporthe batatas TaxID=748121 RepID=UPI001D051CC6|nr:uncharacterized protein KVR01_007997 [Diaporthe batatas]KAG8162232.1 hypothetical protein KVR01_007997 [Diaporthe batatas]